MKQGLIPRYFSRFNIVEGYYWWLVDHHGGQWSTEYERMCKIQKYFKPGVCSNGPSDELSQEVYDSLCLKAGCTHLEE